MKTVKHGGAKVIWYRVCLSYYGVAMGQHVYVNIIEMFMWPHASVEMLIKWVFHQDNDPKHTSQKATAWFG